METHTGHINIAVAGTHSIHRCGLSSALSTYKTCRVVAEFDTPQFVLTALAHAKPDVLLLDGSFSDVLSGMSVETLIRTIRTRLEHPPKIIVLLDSMSDAELAGILSARVEALCYDSINSKALETVITHVYQGGVWFDPPVAEYVLSVLASALPWVSAADNTGSIAMLSGREQQVLALMTEGLNNRQIAEKLSLSVHTIKAEVSQIFRKLEVGDRVEAVVKVLRYGNTQAVTAEIIA